MTSKGGTVLGISSIHGDTGAKAQGDERKPVRAPAGAAQQKKVTVLFNSTAERWKTLYESSDIYGRIFQRRLATALSFVDKIGLEANSEILDVGCGAGLASVALAERGHFVEALDVAPSMLRVTRELASQAGVADRVKARAGDVHNLAFPNETFDAVLAIGVTAWMDSLQVPLEEIFRTLKPGGHLIITAANRWGLHRTLDPRLNPALEPARRAAMYLLPPHVRRERLNRARYRCYSSQEFDSILASAGFRKLESSMVGFGPFSILGRKILPPAVGLFLDRRLQRLADGKTSFLKSAGHIYLVLAQKGKPVTS